MNFSSTYSLRRNGATQRDSKIKAAIVMRKQHEKEENFLSLARLSFWSGSRRAVMGSAQQHLSQLWDVYRRL